MKATNQGHCQVCGRLQRLPDGVLAKHGYTAKWGFFAGVCWGSQHKPFEESIALIEEAIKRARETAKGLRAQADAVEGSCERVWINEFVRSTHRYVWRELPIGDVSFDEFGNISYVDLDGKPKHVRTHTSRYQRTHEQVIEAAIGSLNKERALDLRNLAAEHEKYVQWQLGRIEGWRPHPEKLIPVK